MADALETLFADDTPPAIAPSLLGAALWYAEQGLRVFPLSPRSKVPFKGSNGCLGATSNAELIRDWWDRDPEANVGIATGYLIDVVDIDPPDGQKSRATWWCVKGPECAARHARPGEHSAELSDQDGGDAVWMACDHDPGVFARIEAAHVGKVLTPRPGGMHLYVPTTGRGNSASPSMIAPGVDYRGLGGYVVAPPSVLENGTYRFLGAPQLAELSP